MIKKDKDFDVEDGASEEGVFKSARHDKPPREGINNTDLPGVPEFKKAKNNPTHQDEGLSGYVGDSTLIADSDL